MIKTKGDLKKFLDTERQLYNHSFIGMVTQKESCLKYLFLKNLRKAEYHYNNGNKILYKIYMLLNQPIKYKLGFQIPINTLGLGIRIFHYGYLIINYKSKIGSNCVLYPGVVLGQKDNKGAPVIGDNCFIGLGAKLFGNISIGNNCTVAPNSVVVRSFPDNCIIGGYRQKY